MIYVRKQYFLWMFIYFVCAQLRCQTAFIQDLSLKSVTHYYFVYSAYMHQMLCQRYWIWKVINFFWIVKSSLHICRFHTLHQLSEKFMCQSRIGRKFDDFDSPLAIFDHLNSTFNWPQQQVRIYLMSRPSPSLSTIHVFFTTDFDIERTYCIQNFVQWRCCIWWKPAMFRILQVRSLFWTDFTWDLERSNEWSQNWQCNTVLESYIRFFE